MNKNIIISIAVIILALGGLVLATSSSDDSSDSTEVTKTETSVDTETPAVDNTLAAFTAADVAEHATGNDCWTIIEGNVYDITDYIPRHPGGDEILRACGADGTSLFTERETTDGEQVGSGRPHSSGAEAQLAPFQVGTLAS